MRLEVHSSENWLKVEHASNVKRSQEIVKCQWEKFWCKRVFIERKVLTEESWKSWRGRCSIHWRYQSSSIDKMRHSAVMADFPSRNLNKVLWFKCMMKAPWIRSAFSQKGGDREKGRGLTCFKSFSRANVEAIKFLFFFETCF